MMMAKVNRARRHTRPVAVATGAMALLASVLSACGGSTGSGGTGADAAAQATQATTASASASGGVEADSTDKAQTLAAKSSTSAAASAVAQPANTEGRLLASNCFQCHGTMGTGGFDAIRGQEASEVLEFLRKPAGNSIMAAHAQGYTSAQLQKIIAYLQQ